MKPGYGSARRNRNCGTAKSGHGQDNRFRIPTTRGGAFWESLGAYTKLSLDVHGRNLLFVIEHTNSDFSYACTVDDVVELLAMVPEEDLEQLQAIVFRQSTRKQKIGAPTWGRLDYWAELKSGQVVVSAGPTIFLEAVKTVESWRLSRSESPQESKERGRLVEDGHEIQSTRRQFVVTSGVEACRNTQLYRTLLHEIGHWVDWLTKVERPSRAADFEQLSERYFQRPAVEREIFAHRYADTLRQQLLTERRIPFNRILEPSQILNRGLRIEDFQIPR